MMEVVKVAGWLVDTVVSKQQVALRLTPGTEVEALRVAVRRAARARRVKIRTGLVGDVLAVALVNADLWTDSAATMRQKLAPTDLPSDN